MDVLYYSLVRFEQELAVLEDDDETIHNLPRALLPADARPGEVFLRQGDAFLPAPEETARRRKEILRLQEKLRRK